MTNCLERSDATIAIREGQYKVGKPAKDSISPLLALSACNALKFDLQHVVLNLGGLLVGLSLFLPDLRATLTRSRITCV
jgi:hypothetical protein